ncbi:MAG: inorganic phosphate transporter [Tannerella sp.]|uniref:inorganic phosphate transporter n=1 Tax=Coprobacter fastidiosus TaxID=1099853 RepID=UPI001DB5418A|nr:inorganic phosphate transporter [Coprobacter fastidiosus]MBS6409398.1 inorganic phosphate transporter [Tannerella sp.]HJF42048.1 inorganic phosphate transporter [Coprobacter fastidiosus]
METFYLGIVIFLFILAIFDLVVGVSNDAVNFLNSAIGAKAAPFKAIMCIAAIGIFIGASLSNGMMDIARHGIYQPEHFYFTEIMCILIAVMLTDVVLLDMFNSLGMPTSTTVSLVFELLGGTFALSIIKIAGDHSLEFGQLLNTDKALSVILAIFVSVAIAFFFGTVVQYIARLIFTFNYKKQMKYFAAIFGGIAITTIIYFVLISGLKESSFMTPENKLWIKENTGSLILYCFIGSTILMQIFQWIHINVFKVIVLVGTFALALAFAGNDLVNFIGVPLAGYSSFIDLSSQPGADPDTYLMTSLMGSAHTPWYFLVSAGLVMVIALFTSKKAHNVVKTSVDLSRQEEGEEAFGTSPVARVIVRLSSSVNSSLSNIVPDKIKRWIDARFNTDDAILAEGAAFDLIRASVNLVLAGFLIAMGTALKLPLSTTYVAFMVAMGSSLADRAWSRESAVYRITGVLSVIGGWFITAGAAFFICFFVTTIIHFGGTIAIIAFIGLAIFSLIRSQLVYKKALTKQKGDPTVQKLMSSHDTQEALSLLRKHTRDELGAILEVASQTFDKTVNSFMSESYRGLRKAMNLIDDEKDHIKKVKRIGTLGVAHLDNNTAIEKGLYYYQGNDFISEVIYSIGRICEPCLEHTDNNFNPLQEAQKEEFKHISEGITDFLEQARNIILQNDYTNFEEAISTANHLINSLAQLKRAELKRIQGQTGSLKVSMVYLTMIQEAQNVVAYTSNLLKVSRKFQVEE